MLIIPAKNAQRRERIYHAKITRLARYVAVQCSGSSSSSGVGIEANFDLQLQLCNSLLFLLVGMTVNGRDSQTQVRRSRRGSTGCYT